MTIEEAVRHCYEVAENNCTDCGKKHLQLAEWLRELDRLRIENSALRLAIASVPEMDWIPCSERLPEDYKKVLIYGRETGVLIGFFTSYKNLYISDNGNTATRSSAITHWMPLPEPPEMDRDTDNSKEDENE